MCFNVSIINSSKAKLTERYKEVLPDAGSLFNIKAELPTFYFVSGFSHPLLPIIKHDGFFLYEWGLIPLWVKEVTIANNIRTKTLNAVGETVFEKPSFRKSILSQRCILSVSGFYEWRDVNKVKYPYFIKTKNDDLFSLGCIYETWVDKSTGEIRNTFSILTTPANPLMEKVHNIKKRMPLILSSQNEMKWLEPNLSVGEINSLIKPYDEADMTAYTISKIANSAKQNRNVPEIIEKICYPELEN